MAGDREVALGEVAELVRGVSYRPADLVDDGTEAVPLLRATNIGSGTLDLSDVLYVPPRLVRHTQLLRRFDVVIAMSSGSRKAVGRLAQLRRDWAGCVGAFCGVIRPDPERVHPEYLCYVLQSREFRQRIESHAVGTAIMNLSKDRILGFKLQLPSKTEQRAIAHILGTLDDKIELNRRMNETLEAMARALFKSWFVDFEPVRAKAEGRWRRGESLPGLPAHLFDLFPDSFEDSELGEIPQGWEVKSIGDLAEVVGGSTPRTEKAEYWDGGRHHWVTPKDLSRLSIPVLLDTERKITDAGLAQVSSGLLPKGTVLLSSRAPIGYLSIAEVPVAINQGFIAMKPRSGISNLFLLRWASTAHDEIVSHANGSTFLEISKSSFRPIRTVAPAAPVMAAFDRVSRPMYLKIVEHERESRIFADLRDTLLPKLISGELRIPEASHLLEKAT